MREIKFRGWNLLEDEPHMFYFDLEIIRDEDNEANWQNMNYIMQYTGLKYKNGVGVYEGDVIKFNDGPKFYTGEVKYGEFDAYWPTGAHEMATAIGFYVYANDWGYSLSEILADKYEVVGNIHENPELIK